MEKKEYDKALLEAVLLLLEKAHAGHHPANSDYGKYLKAAEALKQPQEYTKLGGQREYFVNVWRSKDDGRIEGESFNTKEEAERNIRVTDMYHKYHWQLIGQHQGTYEVEK